MGPGDERQPGELTVAEATEKLGISRQRLNDYLGDGTLPSRLVLYKGRGLRLLDGAAVELLLAQRTADRVKQTGKGRRIVLPEGEPAAPETQ